MPELPEVETVRRGLAGCLPGRVLRQATLQRSDLRWRIPVAAVRRLEGSRLTKITRRAKYLQLRFRAPVPQVALIHLGMSGQLWVDAIGPRATRPDWQPHEHWRMDFGNRLLRYVDARRFGMLDVVPETKLERHKLIAELGPEPLAPDQFDAETLFRQSRGRRVAVKTYLMSARNVVGIGNIYASEICFRAGVRPGRRVARTTRAECARLVDATRAVLEEAIHQGGTTLRDYISVDQTSGYFQQSLAVYDRAGEECMRCGARIKRTVGQGRSTYYCPGCQR